IDPGERNEMMLAAGIRIVLGQFHLIPPRAEDFHVFLDHRRCDHMCSSLHSEEKRPPRGGGSSGAAVGTAARRRREDYPASAARMRAQLRVPLWNEVRSNFSFGECTRSSSSANPTMIVSMPSTRLKSPTIGIEPPSPMVMAFLPHSAESAA